MRPCSIFRVGALWVALFSLLLPWGETPGAESNIGKQVTLIFKDKSRASQSGTLVEDGKERVAIQTGDATATFQKGDIERIVLKKPVEEQFKERLARCKTADEFVALAKWCGQPDVKLPGERRRCLDEAIKLSPDHAAARTELGQVKVDGQWVDEEEHKRKLGYVEGPDGKLYPPDEAKRLEEEEARKKAEKSGQAKGLSKRLKQDEGIPWAVAKVLRDKNFILKCNAGDETSKRYLQVLNSLHRRYSELFSGFTPLYTGPGTVYVFRNHEEYLDFTMAKDAAGFFRFDDRSVRAYHGSFGPTGSTDMVLAHEVTHQFQHRIMKEMPFVPNWLIEGMASYFGDGTKITPSRVEVGVIPRNRLHPLREAMETNRYTNIEKLLLIPHGDLRAYDHGWGIIFWCLQGNDPKYKFGHKGEGRKVWDQYLRHVSLEIKRSRTPQFMADEAKYFLDLLLKETKAASVAKWEEGYKKFILNLPIEPLGKWNGKVWDSINKTGIQLTVPQMFQPVDDKEVRQTRREAAAAVTADGARLWVMVDGKWENEPEQILQNFIHGTFIDREFDEDFDEDEVRPVKVNGIFDGVESSFKGKVPRQRESMMRGGAEPGEKDEPGKKAGGKGATPKKKDPSALVVDELQRVRVTMIHTPDRLYFITLNGPEGAFSKVEPYFEEILNSVKVNFALGK